MSSPDDRATMLDQLTREHEHAPWHGPARRDVLRGISATMAAAHPVLGAHSIWELVLHMTAWTAEVDRRMHAGNASDPAMGDWPKPAAPGDANWIAALADLESAHASIRRTITALTSVEWNEVLPDKRGTPAPIETRRTLAWGLVQHDVYHTGQIALLKRALTP